MEAPDWPWPPLMGTAQRRRLFSRSIAALLNSTGKITFSKDRHVTLTSSVGMRWDMKFVPNYGILK